MAKTSKKDVKKIGDLLAEMDWIPYHKKPENWDKPVKPCESCGCMKLGGDKEDIDNTRNDISIIIDAVRNLK